MYTGWLCFMLYSNNAVSSAWGFFYFVKKSQSNEGYEIDFYYSKENIIRVVFDCAGTTNADKGDG